MRAGLTGSVARAPRYKCRMELDRLGKSAWSRTSAWLEVMRARPKLSTSILMFIAGIVGLGLPGWLAVVWSIAWTVPAAVVLVLDLKEQRSGFDFREAENLPPTTFAPPYSSWLRVSEGRRELVTSPAFNKVLRDELVSLPFSVEPEQWRILDPVVEEARLRWALDNRNDAKIRMSSDPDLEDLGKPVLLQITDYASFVVTNRLAYEEITAHKSLHTVLRFEDLDGEGRLPPLALSQSSNHIGGDLLLVAPNGMVFLQQGEGNGIYPGHWVASSSGSFDYPKDLRGAIDLRDIVKSGLTRELREEAGLPKTHVIPANDVKIIGFGRATYFGGKPQFFGVARTSTLVNPKIKGEEKSKRYAKAHALIPVSLDENGAGIMRAIDKFMSTHYLISPSLVALSEMMRDWFEDDEEAGDWLLQYVR